MGRKNNAVRRKNNSSRGRRDRDEFRPAIQPTIPRIKVEDMVMPDGQCLFPNPRRPKAKFNTEEKARKALAQAQHQRARMGSTHVEKRYYACPEGGCGGFHLTSREAFDEEIWNRKRPAQ